MSVSIMSLGSHEGHNMGYISSPTSFRIVAFVEGLHM